MTQDEIIEMARQAGIDIEMWEKLSIDDDVFGYGIDGTHENLVAFANLVAAKEREEANAKANASWTLMCKKMVAIEREACAKVVDDIEARCIAKDVDDSPLNYVAKAIRDRGEA